MKTAPRGWVIFKCKQAGDFEVQNDNRFNDDRIDYWDWLDNNFNGKKLPADWKLPKHSMGNTKLPLRDFVQGYTEAPFVSQRVIDSIAEDVDGSNSHFDRR